MSHLTEGQLVDLLYGEAGPDSGRHLEACPHCTQALEALRSDLAQLAPIPLPDPGPAFGERVWSALAPSLEPYPSRPRPWYRTRLAQGIAYAAAALLLVATAFYAGRQWENARQPRITAARQAPPAPQPVLLVVLGDHLDRSERLLVELKHADPASSDTAAPLREQARILLAANRACRQDATKIGDPALSFALDRLDSLLVQIAAQPEGLDAAGLARLQRDLTAGGLLFQVRVLRSRLPDRSATPNTRPSGGTI